MGHYHSVSSAVYAKIVRQRAAAVEARHAGRQAAHDSAASARAAAKREERRVAITSRGRGQTQIVGHRDDGSPVYRAIAAFRARPYTAPEARVKREERGALPIAGMRSHEETRDAAIKAEAPQERSLWDRALDANDAGDYEKGAALGDLDAKRFAQRAARKVRMARRRRRGF